MCVNQAAAQAAAEYGKTASAAAGAATQAKTAIVAAPPSPTAKPGSKHLPMGLQPKGLPEENRRALLESAGEQPAMVLLRSEPAGAQVWMNGKAVGATPLLLVVAPGAHVVELRGARNSRARQGIILAPDEKKEVVLSLKTRYPSQVQLH
ncbi:MAG: PEGA domain-containing protein [Acidobacteria bacterium]|nr:PEGA domain-containing protein [Acidobacteriota bacterium]